MSKKRRYALERRIGKGGMGEVFRGEHRGALGFTAPVAIKRLPDSRAKDFDARMMLQQEAALCATLEHPNLVPVFDFDQDSQGDVRLIMMFVDGVDLDALIESGPLPLPVVMYIISSVLCGLAYIHKRGIIHRDITPGNILISRSGAVRITDFGLATSIERANLAAVHSGGTIGFMSPEAIRNESLDCRSDLFSLGAVLYRLLTSVLPFPAEETLERMGQTLCVTPVPPHVVCPDVPRELSDLTMRLLSPSREDRFASAVEVLDMLPDMPAFKYGSEDLAELLEERHEQGRLRLPSMPHEPSSENPGEERNGAKSAESLSRQATLPYPTLQFDHRPRIDVDVWRQALAEHDAVPRWVSRDVEHPLDTAEALREASEALRPVPARNASRRTRMPPWLRVSFALMAVASIYVWGTLGLRALRIHAHDPQTHTPRNVEAAEQADRAIESPVSPGPSKVVEPVPTPPLRKSSDDNNAMDALIRQSIDRATARERPSQARRSKGLIAQPDTGEDENISMDARQPETSTSSLEDPTAVDPFERFAGPMGNTLPGEVVIQP